MITIEQLKELKTQIEKLEQQKQEAKKKFLSKIFGTRAIDRKIEELNKELVQKSKEYLEKENEEFKTLAGKNLQMLKRDKIIYKVHYVAYSVIGTYSSAFEGRLNRNGLSYVEAVKTNVGVLPLSQYEYPEKLMGHIDYFGNIEMETKQIGRSILRTLPRKYIGYVNDKGVIVLEVDKREVEFANGHNVMARLLGGHFPSPEATRDFFDNARRLKEILDGFIESLNCSELK